MKGDCAIKSYVAHYFNHNTLTGDVESGLCLVHANSATDAVLALRTNLGLLQAQISLVETKNPPLSYFHAKADSETVSENMFRAPEEVWRIEIKASTTE